MEPGQRRGPWSNTEDRFLMSLIERHGPLNWVRIAQVLGSRTPKQCRERYHQNLKPSLNHDPITPEEGARIESLVRTVGKRWAEIARRLNGRSDNAVKNWWNGSQNRRKRLNRRRASLQASGIEPSSSTSPSPSPSHDHRMQRAPLSIMSPVLPVPYSNYPISPMSGSIGSRNRFGSWAEGPLPSPCSSEPLDSESSPNYTTSPAGPSRSPYYHLPQVQLPPLREWLQPEYQLPRISSMGVYDEGSFGRDFNRLPPLPSPFDIMTTPDSPLTQKEQEGNEQRYEQSERELQIYPQQSRACDANVEKSSIDKADKMKVASLLT